MSVMKPGGFSELMVLFASLGVSIHSYFPPVRIGEFATHALTRNVSGRGVPLRSPTAPGQQEASCVRPRNPDDLQVLISNENIPDDFLRGDVSVGDRRHILFATDRMLDLLAQTKHWYDIVF